MKQILLVLGMMCSLIGAQAESTQTYTEDLVVTINEETTPTQQAVIEVVFQENGTMNLTLKNFILQNANPQTGDVDQLPVGNIVVQDVALTDAEGYKTFGGTQTIVMADGDPELSPFWIGPAIGAIDIVYQGQINEK